MSLHVVVMMFMCNGRDCGFDFINFIKLKDLAACSGPKIVFNRSTMIKNGECMLK